MKVGLVLGGGGVMGGAWMTGGLYALAQETGWDPATADYIVGTSAGAMMGSLTALGVPAWFMVAHSAGEVFDGLLDARGEPVARADRSAGATFRLHRGLPRLLPGSPRLIASTLRNPRRHTPVALLAAWAPWGLFSNEPLKDVVRRALPHGWAPHPHLWICACDYETGRRVVFGRPGAPRAELADAVAASCAIPGFYRPVTIGGRVYVDGGVHSASNADVLRDEKLDLVICFNPTTPMQARSGRWPHQRMAAGLRALVAGRLEAELEGLRKTGANVVLVRPTEADLDRMGSNWMSTRRRHAVIELAIRTVGDQLRDPANANLLKELPRGEPERIRRPAGPPSTWPPLSVGAGQRQASEAAGGVP